jgi:hypothetical protein
MLYTNFNLLREAGACKKSYRNLAKYLGGVKKYGRDTDIPLSTILDSNGLDDTIWCLQCCTDDTKAGKFFQSLACDYAEHVLHIYEKQYHDDDRPRKAIEASRLYLKGEATIEELAASRTAAWAASRTASRAASRAAWAASRAAWAAAWAAAGAAAWAAAWAALAAAWAAEAATGASRAAWTAAEAAAWAAAWAAEEEWQTNRLKELLNVSPAWTERM